MTSSGSHGSGRYASYWNASLFLYVCSLLHSFRLLVNYCGHTIVSWNTRLIPSPVFSTHWTLCEITLQQWCMVILNWFLLNEVHYLCLWRIDWNTKLRIELSIYHVSRKFLKKNVSFLIIFNNEIKFVSFGRYMRNIYDFFVIIFDDT